MKRPFWIAFFPTKWVQNVATIGPIGFWGKCPGTNGTAVGLVWYTLFFHNLSPLGYFLLTFASVYLAIAICGEAELIFNKKDPVCAILDEVVAVPICFIGLQTAMRQHPMWVVLLLGFILFRIFDIFKPFGINSLQKLDGGLGIVIDDVAAAFLTCVCLHIAVHFI